MIWWTEYSVARASNSCYVCSMARSSPAKSDRLSRNFYGRRSHDALGLGLLWSALQATVLGLVAVALGARPWRIGGAFTPLVALLAIALITVAIFVPMPGWWPATKVADLDHQSNLQVTAQADAKLPSSELAVPPEVEGTVDEVRDRARFSSVSQFGSLVMEELRSVRSQSDQRWSNSMLPIVWSLSLRLPWCSGLFGWC